MDYEEIRILMDEAGDDLCWGDVVCSSRKQRFQNAAQDLYAALACPKNDGAPHFPDWGALDCRFCALSFATIRERQAAALAKARGEEVAP